MKETSSLPLSPAAARIWGMEHAKASFQARSPKNRPSIWELFRRSYWT